MSHSNLIIVITSSKHIEYLLEETSQWQQCLIKCREHTVLWYCNIVESKQLTYCKMPNKDGLPRILAAKLICTLCSLCITWKRSTSPHHSVTRSHLMRMAMPFQYMMSWTGCGALTKVRKFRTLVKLRVWHLKVKNWHSMKTKSSGTLIPNRLLLFTNVFALVVYDTLYCNIFKCCPVTLI